MKVKYIQHCGDDLSVVNAARVSFGKKSKGKEEWVIDPNPESRSYSLKLHPTERDKKLIKYLADHNHKSPFNHTFITLHVKAPIFVARQLVKHKFLPWNEVSRRYVDDEPEFYWPDKWRARAEDKKQGSSDNTIYPKLNEYCEKYRNEDYLCDYKELLKEGVCPEQARMVLPLNTYTEWYWSGTLGAWADMYNLRSKPDAQLETQEIANQCGEIIKPLFPVSWKELTK